MEIVGQFNDMPGNLPTRESQTLAVEIILKKALESGIEDEVINSPAWLQYSEQQTQSA